MDNEISLKDLWNALWNKKLYISIFGMIISFVLVSLTFVTTTFIIKSNDRYSINFNYMSDGIHFINGEEIKLTSSELKTALYNSIDETITEADCDKLLENGFIIIEDTTVLTKSKYFLTVNLEIEFDAKVYSELSLDESYLNNFENKIVNELKNKLLVEKYSYDLYSDLELPTFDNTDNDYLKHVISLYKYNTALFLIEVLENYSNYYNVTEGNKKLANDVLVLDPENDDYVSVESMTYFINEKHEELLLLNTDIVDNGNVIFNKHTKSDTNDLTTLDDIETAVTSFESDMASETNLRKIDFYEDSISYLITYKSSILENIASGRTTNTYGTGIDYTSLNENLDTILNELYLKYNTVTNLKSEITDNEISVSEKQLLPAIILYPGLIGLSFLIPVTIVLFKEDF